MLTAATIGRPTWVDLDWDLYIAAAIAMRWHGMVMVMVMLMGNGAGLCRCRRHCRRISGRHLRRKVRIQSETERRERRRHPKLSLPQSRQQAISNLQPATCNLQHHNLNHNRKPTQTPIKTHLRKSNRVVLRIIFFSNFLLCVHRHKRFESPAGGIKNPKASEEVLIPQRAQ